MKKTYLLTTAIFCTIQAFGGGQAVPPATNGALPASRSNSIAAPAAPAVGAPPAGMPGMGTPPAAGIPGMAAPAVGAPPAGMPGMGIPPVGIPGIAGPGAGAPPAGMPGMGTPPAGMPGMGMPGMAAPPAGMPGMGMPGMAAPGATATDSDAPALPATFMKKLPEPLPGALPSRKKKSSKSGGPVAPLPIPNIPGIIAYVDLKTAQQAIDDATAFAVMDTGGRISCFADNNSVMRTGILVTENTQPTKCYLLDPSTGSGKMTDSFQVPISNAPIHWVVGTSSNPDQWITGKADQMPTDDPLNPATGICAQNDGSGKPALLGSAVRRRGEPHTCILPNGEYPINNEKILVLAK